MNNSPMTEKDLIQVVEYLEDGTVRVYKIKEVRMGDTQDPLTTIEVEGYEDIGMRID